MTNHDLRDILEILSRKEGWTISDFATRAGLDRSYLSKLINQDESTPLTDKMVRKLATVLPSITDVEKLIKLNPAAFSPKNLFQAGMGMSEVNEIQTEYKMAAHSMNDHAARTQELIDTLKEHNKVLKDVIEKNLNGLQANLRTSQLLLRSLQTSQSAQHDVMMGSLERLEKRKKGSLAADADKLELELNLQLQGMGSNADGGK